MACNLLVDTCLHLPWDDDAEWVHPDTMPVEPCTLVAHAKDSVGPPCSSSLHLRAEGSLLVWRQLLPWLVRMVVRAPGLEDLQNGLGCTWLPCLRVEAGLRALGDD